MGWGTKFTVLAGCCAAMGLVLAGTGVAHGFSQLGTTVGTFTDVVWEPSAENPERIQLHGVFWSLSWVENPDGSCEPELEGISGSGMDCRTAPTEGYLYYWCDPAVEVLTAEGWQPVTLERCVADWQALVQRHEQEGCVGFGQFFLDEPMGAERMVEPVRAPGSPPVDPDTYHPFGGSSKEAALFTLCEDVALATPPACGDGVHHAGEWCDGNCYPGAGEECQNSGAPIAQVEYGINCGCGAVEPAGSPESCDLRCVDNRLPHSVDSDGCCRSDSWVTYCDGGCCVDPEMSAGTDSDCVPGALIQIPCHSDQDCGDGGSCVHPNTAQSYCSNGSEPVPADVVVGSDDAGLSEPPETGPTDEPEGDAVDGPMTDASEGPGTEPEGEPVSADTSSGGCAAGASAGDVGLPWWLLAGAGLCAIRRRRVAQG